MTITINQRNGEKITATPDVLNFISILASEAYDRFKEKEYLGLADEAFTVSNEIYEALKKSGYYNK